VLRHPNRSQDEDDRSNRSDESSKRPYLEAGASVARVARRHAVNANQVFYWRKKYREGRLGKNQSSKLLPETVSDISWSKSGRAGCAPSPSAVGSMEIKLPKGTLRVAGAGQDAKKTIALAFP
jgi:transposase-like protein